MSMVASFFGSMDAWVAAQADPRSGSSAQRGRNHNPRIIESRMQGYIV
jgi:hypothetical protein